MVGWGRNRVMAKAIMIQGTMSNVGKSLVAAGLCRIFMQDGYKVAPFKSQNMALNSYVTADGLEMGRAQVMQAEAAGVLPSVRMNPILLKPTTDMGSQVIVGGVSIGNMHAKDYFAYKKELIPVIREAYEALAREYDILVIEGAGSPAEMNLKQDDIVNMGLAELVDAPVLLVGDIDRGGVFAQLYGTTELLSAEEKRRIKGLVVNKFRGDVSILEPGIKQIEELCGIPVVGVVPYMDVDIDDEDSLSERLRTKREKPADRDLRVEVIRFPRISNFTDFSVFSCIPGVNLSYVNRPEELENPDFILLPGTKNTISDLLWMRGNGLEERIIELVNQGIPVWGICGGYQMLGEVLEDPQGVEGEKGRVVNGMGLLPIRTVFAEEKTRTQVEGAFSQVEGIFEELSGKSFLGYEIHMGKTWIDRENGPADTARFFQERLEICRPLSYLLSLQDASKKMHEDGWSRGNVYGCYTHGIFDQTAVIQTVVNALRKEKGLDLLELDAFDYRNYKEQQYNQLADTLRRHLDMEKIYQILDAKEEKAEEQRKDEQFIDGKIIEDEIIENKVIEELLPSEIEARSFAQISRELEERKILLEPGRSEIVKRAIHTTADFDYAENLCFSPGAVEKALWALSHGAVIVTDTNMAKAGINKRKAEAYHVQIYCFMADEDVAREAKAKGCTRAAASMEKAVRLFGTASGVQRPVIFAIGNAPTALICLNQRMDEGKCSPALIIGVPVGFVHVVFAKELIVKREDVPYIVARGRKGGSNVAAAIVNALFYQLA